MLALPYPAPNKTIHFVLDTLRRKTLITPEARLALGVVDGPGVGDQPDFGACIELPAARIGNELGDHFLVVMDAVVANVEQASVMHVGVVALLPLGREVGDEVALSECCMLPVAVTKRTNWPNICPQFFVFLGC